MAQINVEFYLQLEIFDFAREKIVKQIKCAQNIDEIHSLLLVKSIITETILYIN